MSMKLSRTYRKWDSMIARCYRKSHPAFEYYGGKGITVCDRWRNDYKAFLEDMGEAPDGLWLDRIDNSRGYEPGNCRWVTPAQSASNRRPRPKVPDSLKGRCRVAGVAYSLVYARIARGWPEHLAMSIPTQNRGGMTHYDKARLGLI